MMKLYSPLPSPSIFLFGYKWPPSSPATVKFTRPDWLLVWYGMDFALMTGAPVSSS